MKQRDILALVEGIAPGIDASFQKAIAPLVARLVAAEERAAQFDEFLLRLKAVEDRPAFDLDVVAPKIDDAVRSSLDAVVAALPVPKDGTSVTTEDVAPIIEAAVKEAVAAIELPVAKDGEPGKDGTSVTTEDVAPIIEAAVKQAVAAIELPVAKDGIGLAGAMKDHEGCLVLTLTNGDLVKLGRVDGERGTDGLGYDDLEVVQKDERTFAISFARGDHVKEYVFSLPVVLDRGVFKEGNEYVPGDGVTCGGSFWIAQKQTKLRPGTNDEWRLAVKKGRDGKDFEATKSNAKVKL